MTLIHYDRHGHYAISDGHLYRPRVSAESLSADKDIDTEVYEGLSIASEYRANECELLLRLTFKRKEVWYRHLDKQNPKPKSFHRIQRESDQHWNPREKTSPNTFQSA